MTANQIKMKKALDMIAKGVMRVDTAAGLVYRTFTTELYSYERPVGVLAKNGYVRIYFGAGMQSVYAHRLIWAAAYGEIDDEMVVNHKNNVRCDNRLTNLELLTYRANGAHAAATGRMPKGERHPASKISDVQAREVRRAALAEEGTYGQLAERYGISRSLVSHIVTGAGRFRDL